MPVSNWFFAISSWEEISELFPHFHGHGWPWNRFSHWWTSKCADENIKIFLNNSYSLKQVKSTISGSYIIHLLIHLDIYWLWFLSWRTEAHCLSSKTDDIGYLIFLNILSNCEPVSEYKFNRFIRSIESLVKIAEYPIKFQFVPAQCSVIYCEPCRLYWTFVLPSSFSYSFCIQIVLESLRNQTLIQILWNSLES